MHTMLMNKARVIASVFVFAVSATSVAWAESVDEVEARVIAARDSGQIDQQTYADLQTCLDELRAASNFLEYQSAAEAYNLLAPPELTASFGL